VAWPAPRRALEVALVALLLALHLRTFVLQIVAVPTGSMAPALAAGDVVVVNRLVYAADVPAPLAALLPVAAPRVGDVVVFRSPEALARLLVKRCVATGGGAFAGGYLPAGTLALVGDNARLSHDSRAFGPVARSLVVGRAALVLWSVERQGGGGGRLRWARILTRVR
jgi:signal peptidase I